MNNTERIAGETARDFALRVIRDNIVSLDLKPGTLVSENEIAFELGLSRTPVREAIIELSKASIIEIYPQKGSYVSLIDSKMVEESRFLRNVLDSAVIEVACDLASDKDLNEMEENVLLQEFFLSRGENEKIYPLDNDFHKMIYNIAEKRNIYEMRSIMMIHFDRVRTLSVETVKDLKIVSDHRGMYEAIKNHDKEKAVQLVNKHLGRYQFDENAIREQFSEYFK
ncbi:MAG: GntR family transcriptional regulator [Lachnospiraceae bacterium]|nr:GntR family transcriptional regulator [Lachnospiraceae bacterium]